MASIDERVVAMSFENQKFEAGIAQTLKSLSKLDAALKQIGAVNGLADIEKASNKVTLKGANDAIDKTKGKLNFPEADAAFSNIENASRKVTFGPLGAALDGIKSRFSTAFSGVGGILDGIKTKLGFPGGDQGLKNIEATAANTRLSGVTSALNNVHDKLQFRNAAGQFATLEKESSKVTLAPLTGAISSVQTHFTAMQAVALGALTSIGAKAVSAGANIVKSLTIDPLKQGFEEYATNLNSVQTILANTQASGATLKDVNATLLDLNKYSDQTIYNFGQMAKNIGTFTAAGVDLKTSTASIKGIANLAALSGSNSEQAATAMYQLSQAIASGKVGLQDWNSVVNAGMGGATFQRALAQTAQQMGTIKDGALKLKGPMKNVTIDGQSFRESIMAKPGEQSWLTSDVLTNTLKQFTGDLSDAELKAQGFSDAQIKAIQATAKTAKNAATQIKTAGQLFDVVKESIGSGWSQTFQNIFGDFGEAKKLFTDIGGSITGFVSANANARNKVLADWKELGGRTDLIESIKNIFKGLSSVIKPVKDAFREIFPKRTGADLAELTKRFRDFTETLKIGPETAENLKRTFKGFFAVLDIGKEIVSGLFHVLGDLFGAAGDGSGGFLRLTAKIGDFLVEVRDAIKQGNGLTKFFDGLGAVLSKPIELIGHLGDAIADLFGGGKSSAGISKSFKDMGDSLSPLEKAVDKTSDAWDRFVNALRKVKDALKPVVHDIAEAFSGVGDAIVQVFEGMSFERVFKVIQTGLLGGIFLVLKKGIGKGINVDLGGGVLEGLKDTFGALTGNLKAMQTNLKADTLLKIAGAVAALSAGVLVFSTIDPKKLNSAMTATAVGLGQLVGAMALLTKIGGVTAFAQMPFIAGSLILLAGAVDVLAIAVKAFSTMDWEELAKGLAGVGGALTAVAFGTKLMSGPNLILVGPALLPIAFALNIMAGAVKLFSLLDWEEIGKGLAGVAGSLIAIGAASKLMGPSMIGIGPGLVAVGIGLNIIALAVKKFGGLDMETIGKGLLGIGGSLVVIGGALRLFPPGLALQAAGLVAVAVAINGIGLAVKVFGGMDIITLAKGIGAIGVSLGVLAGGLTLMSGTFGGSAALVAAAGGLAILTPSIAFLGNMKFTTIAKGLGTIAAALGILSVAGIGAGPGLLALGAAMAALGIAIGAAGGGVYLFAKGLSLLAQNGVAGIAALVKGLWEMAKAVPVAIGRFLKGLVQIVEDIALLAPRVAVAMGRIIVSLLNVVIQAAPKLAQATIALIGAFLDVLNEKGDDIIRSGAELLVNFLRGIRDNIADVTKMTLEIVENFLIAVASKLPSVISAGSQVLTKFLAGIARELPDVISSAAKVIVTFLTKITEKMPEVIAAGAKMILKFLEGVADKADDLILAGGKVINRILEGLGNAIPKILEKGVAAAAKFIEGVGDNAPKLIQAGFNAVIKFIEGVGNAIGDRKNADKLTGAGETMARGIINGFINVIESSAQRMIDAIAGLLDKVVDRGKGLFNSTVGKLPGVPDFKRRVAIPFDMQVTSSSVDTSGFSFLQDRIQTEVNATRPVISPVLDLTEIKRQAALIPSVVGPIPIQVDLSYSQAVQISADRLAIMSADVDESTTPVLKEIKFEQNNYSPESLSEIDIYRLTRNQLSQARSALT